MLLEGVSFAGAFYVFFAQDIVNSTDMFRKWSTLMLGEGRKLGVCVYVHAAPEIKPYLYPGNDDANAQGSLVGL